MHIKTQSRERGKRETGGAEKADDRWTLPGCKMVPGVKRGCHGDQHHAGDEMAYWRSVGIDPHARAERYFAKYVAAGGAAEPVQHAARKPPRNAKAAPKAHRRAPGGQQGPKKPWPKGRKLPTGRKFGK